MSKAVGLCVVIVAVAASAAARADVAAHAMVVAGRAGHVGGGLFDCATSGPQAREAAFFNTGVGLPTEGYSYCGLSGGVQDLTGATSTGVAHESATGSFPDPGAATVSADAKASIGSLSVRASGSNTAPSYDGFNYAEAEGAAYYSDAVTFAGTGTSRMIFQFSLDGSASVTTNSQILTLLNYKIGSGPVYGAFTGDLLGSGTAIARNNTGSGVNPMPGFTVAPGSLSGSGDVYTFATDVTLGVPTLMEVGLYAAAYPASFGGAADNDFFETAKLSAIDFVDSSGAIINTPVVGLGSSGYRYDSTGAHAPAVASAPEPATWALVIGGVGMIGQALRRKRRRLVAGSRFQPGSDLASAQQ